MPICAFFKNSDKPRIQADHHCQPGDNIHGKAGPLLLKNIVPAVLKRGRSKNEDSELTEHPPRGMNKLNEVTSIVMLDF